jgi:hypothetical protein
MKKLITTIIILAALAFAGCKNFKVDPACAVSAGITCVAEFAKCCEIKGADGKCIGPTAVPAEQKE